MVRVVMILFSLCGGCAIDSMAETSSGGSGAMAEQPRDAGVANSVDPAAIEQWNAGKEAFRRNELDESRDHFEAARELMPEAPGPWRYLALIALRRQRFAECVRLANEALARMHEISRYWDAVVRIRDECRAEAPNPAVRSEGRSL